jgi:hypothetical protein
MGQNNISIISAVWINNKFRVIIVVFIIIIILIIIWI